MFSLCRAKGSTYMYPGLDDSVPVTDPVNPVLDEDETEDCRSGLPRVADIEAEELFRVARAGRAGEEEIADPLRTGPQRRGGLAKYQIHMW